MKIDVYKKFGNKWANHISTNILNLLNHFIVYTWSMYDIIQMTAIRKWRCVCIHNSIFVVLVSVVVVVFAFFFKQNLSIFPCSWITDDDTVRINQFYYRIFTHFFVLWRNQKNLPKLNKLKWVQLINEFIRNLKKKICWFFSSANAFWTYTNNNNQLAKPTNWS